MRIIVNMIFMNAIALKLSVSSRSKMIGIKKNAMQLND